MPKRKCVESVALGFGACALEARLVHAVLDDAELILVENLLRTEGARDRLGDGDDARDVREREAVQRAQREEDVARDDEARRGREPRREGRGRVVARDVRVDDVNLSLPRDAREPARAAEVERVAQRQRVDVLLGQEREVRAERRAFAQRGEDFVAASLEDAREVGEVALAAPERARRADLETRIKAKGRGEGRRSGG